MGQLKKEEKEKLCQMCAEFTSYSEIIKYFKEVFNQHIDNQQIAYYKRTEPWKDIILKIREIWNKGIAEEPFANKRERMKALQKVHDKSMEKDTFHPGPAATTLKLAQEEMEGRKFHLLGKGEEGVGDATAEEIKKWRELMLQKMEEDGD